MQSQERPQSTAGCDPQASTQKLKRATCVHFSETITSVLCPESCVHASPLNPRPFPLCGVSRRRPGFRRGGRCRPECSREGVEAPGHSPERVGPRGRETRQRPLRRSGPRPVSIGQRAARGRAAKCPRARTWDAPGRGRAGVTASPPGRGLTRVCTLSSQGCRTGTVLVTALAPPGLPPHPLPMMTRRRRRMRKQVCFGSTPVLLSTLSHLASTNCPVTVPAWAEGGWALGARCPACLCFSPFGHACPCTSHWTLPAVPTSVRVTCSGSRGLRARERVTEALRGFTVRETGWRSPWTSKWGRFCSYCCHGFPSYLFVDGGVQLTENL